MFLEGHAGYCEDDVGWRKSWYLGGGCGSMEEAVAFVQAGDETMVPWTRLLVVGMERGGHVERWTVIHPA